MNQTPRRRSRHVRIGAWVLSLALAATILLPVMPTKAAVPEDEVLPASTRSVDARATVTLTYGGKALTTRGRTYGGALYVPLAAFAKQFTNATYAYNATTKYATLKANGLVLTAGVGGTMLTANDRPLYTGEVNRMSEGTMWVPAASLAKALGLTVTYRGGSSATVTGSYRALTPASRFYREDEVYWLSRIISAESRGEPLAGQIAVGNVVLNRVRSSAFPNTIWGVIFQKDQFSPVLNGSIHNTPTWSGVTAAKICLEGYSLSEDALFFCNLSVSGSNWITQNRPLAFRIGAHSFFL